MEVKKKRNTDRRGSYIVAGAPNKTSCTNNSYKPGVSMHIFPRNLQQKGSGSLLFRRHRAGFTPSATSVLCSIHFKLTDFARRIDIIIGNQSENIKSLRRLEIGGISTIDAAGTLSGTPKSERDKQNAREVYRV